MRFLVAFGGSSPCPGLARIRIALGGSHQRLLELHLHPIQQFPLGEEQGDRRHRPGERA
jgi:hypothetical protein